jgi:acetylornithine deacetylase/succinyl-diaminopimelate desuccinylase-like protein
MSMQKYAVAVFLLLTMVRLPWAENAVSSAEAATSPRAEVARLIARSDIHAAFGWFAGHVRELAELQMEVSRIPAPPFGEAQRAQWFRTRFIELGLQDVHIDQAGNVLGVRPGTVPGAPCIALTAHMDTVFPAGTPIDIRREGARLFGPGISDNGSGLAALLALANALHETQICTAAPILFVANVGEEGEGDLRGMRQLFSEPRWRDSIAATLVLDGAGTDTTVTEGLGSRRFEAIVHGPGGHSWSDFGTPNPIVVLAHAIELFSRTPLSADRKTSFNIGVISGGTSVNSIPESASMRVDVRSVVPAELDRMEKALRASLTQAVTESNSSEAGARVPEVIRYDLKIIGSRPAAEINPGSRLLQVLRAVDAQLGIISHQQRASTDANIPLAFGRDAVAIGAGGSGGLGSRRALGWSAHLYPTRA